MTTHVLVVNRGPQDVDVHTLSIAPPVVDGMGNSIRTAGLMKTDRLTPSMSREYCLYDSQEIRVSEVK